jgi:hypothetical protein
LFLPHPVPYDMQEKYITCGVGASVLLAASK